MKEILESIYVESLVSVLAFGVDYLEITKISGVKDKIFQSDIINQLLETIERLYRKEELPIIDSEQKNDILSLLSDIRFDYKFKDMQEREDIINKINNCIILLNGITPEFNKVISSVEPEELDAINLYMLINEFVFFIVHYYLQDEETFNNEALPLFKLNPDFYACAIDIIMENYPKLLENIEFLKKTKMVGEECMIYIKENPNILFPYLKKSTLSILDDINKSIKLK